jgi:hypothetical protein
LSRRCGSLDLSHPYGPSRPLTGMAFIRNIVTIFCNLAVTNNSINNSRHKTTTTIKESYNVFFLEINFAQLIETSARLKEEFN